MLQMTSLLVSTMNTDLDVYVTLLYFALPDTAVIRLFAFQPYGFFDTAVIRIFAFQPDGFL